MHIIKHIAALTDGCTDTTEVWIVNKKTGSGL